MFFCCETPEKGDHVIEMFQTPRELSTISHDKSVVLRGFVPGPQTKVINKIQKNQKGAKLENILKYVANNIQAEDFALKKVMKSDYECLLEKFKNSTLKWSDPDFPPEQKSYGLKRQTEKVVWKRINEIIKKPVFIGGGSMHSSDILQGRIGDCYFLSAIAGLAEVDYRIKAIFPSCEINKNGIYCIRLLHKGVFQEVLIDDYFPCSKKDGRLMGCQPAGGDQIWVMLLEKCWAKICGDYQSIDGGLPIEVLHTFSSAPAFEYMTRGDEREQQELFDLMLEGTQNQWVMCCGTYARPDLEELGLVEGHAYTVLSAHSQPRQMVKIRNPWGEMEWKGPASDSDKKFWNSVSKSQKQQLGHSEVDDGIFFMFWEDFLELFQLVDICKINDKANYYYEELTYPLDMPVFSTLTTKGGAATIALTQQSTRGKDVPSPRYAQGTIILAKKINGKTGDDYLYVDSLTVRNQVFIDLEVKLEQGEYVVLSALSGREKKAEATLSCYCESAVQLTPLTSIKSDEFLHRVFLDHARKNKENQQFVFGKVDVWVCMDIIYNSGYAYTAVHIGPTVKTKIGLTFNEEEYIENNFEVLPPFRGAGTFKIVCESGKDSIVLCRIIPKNHAIEASLPIPNIKRLC